MAVQEQQRREKCRGRWDVPGVSSELQNTQFSFNLGPGKTLVLPGCSSQRCWCKSSVPLLLVVPSPPGSASPLPGRSWGPYELSALYPGFLGLLLLIIEM